MISLQFNNTITERDMDLLLAQAALTDPGFCRLLIDKTDLMGREFAVESADISKSDSDLGESDVTIYVNVDGVRYGLLIEDKIDAIAMPDQHGRYVKRGQKAVDAGEYKGVYVFIFCPKKYHENNEEAKLYEHLLTYEECKEYFDRKEDALSKLRSQQLKQALSKAKRTPTNNVNEKANAFLREYIRYQAEYFPSLVLTTGPDKNGWWTNFRTELGYVGITHKIQEGIVDLTFPRAADKSNQAKMIAEWLRKHVLADVTMAKTKISVMFRVSVPKFDMSKGFEEADQEDLEKCFRVIKELAEFANIVETANEIALKR